MILPKHIDCSSPLNETGVVPFFSFSRDRLLVHGARNGVSGEVVKLTSARFIDCQALSQRIILFSPFSKSVSGDQPISLVDLVASGRRRLWSPLENGRN